VLAVFPAKLVIELHDLPRQPFDEMLPKNAILAIGQFGYSLCDLLDHSSASSVSTDPPGAGGYSAKKSSIHAQNGLAVAPAIAPI
jgi:hypothetical protein